MGCGGQLRAHTHTDTLTTRVDADITMKGCCTSAHTTPKPSQVNVRSADSHSTQSQRPSKDVRGRVCVCVCYDVVPWSACFPPLLLLLLQGCCDKNSNGLVPCDGWASVRASQPRPAGVHAQKPHVRSNQTWTVLYLK